MKNEFKNNTEPKKLSEVKTFKATKPEVMEATIGRPAHEHTRRVMPVFEDAIVTFHQPHIAFMHSLIRAELRGGLK